MSIQEQIVQIPATSHMETKSVTCDLCGTVCTTARPTSNGEIDWINVCDVHCTTVHIAEGHGCGDGGSVKHRTYHVCPHCFKDKLEPWLQSQGAQPTEDYENW